jgi:NlpC/P60 family/Bacterial dipeptidyl-peptidase Sh3 domain
MDLDRRIHAYDEAGRVAEVALLGRLDGSFTFIEPAPAWNGGGSFALHSRPEATSPQVSEVLPGEALEVVLERPDGWVWLRTLADGYLGFGQPGHLLDTAPASTLNVTALRGHVYREPSMKSPRLGAVGLGAVLSMQGEVTGGWQAVAWESGRGYSGRGYLAAVCAAPLSDPDPASLALRLLGTPYVWGGRSAWGVDCSGLSGLVYRAFGRALPRDSDQQLKALTPVPQARRGDLAFFPGHVGVMLNERQMVHANSTAMMVSVQTLGEGEYGERLRSELLGFGRWPA